jgi:hypothetical protein
MKYAYEDLSSEKFEELVIVICKRLFGIGVQGFATGPDGGRDAKFVGTAELFPSKAEPWKGITIIQAKHTNGYNKTFSDGEFYSKKSQNTVIGEELPRITKLRINKHVDNYILFANRRLSGITETEINGHISKTCNIPQTGVYLVGIETIEEHLKHWPDIVTIVKIEPVDSPLIVSPDELAEIVEALAKQLTDAQQAIDIPPGTRVSYEEKNVLNKMSKEYAKGQLRKYLKHTKQISTFLAAPENQSFLEQYETVIDEFQFKIIAKIKEQQPFDDVMEYLVDLLFNRDVILRRNKKLTRAMLFYMYWNCDIGKTDAATN